MGALPKERTKFSLPFNVSGVDFAGPFNIKSSTLRNAKLLNGYVAVEKHTKALKPVRTYRWMHFLQHSRDLLEDAAYPAYCFLTMERILLALVASSHLILTAFSKEHIMKFRKNTTF